MIGLDTILKIGEKVLDRVLPDPAAKAEATIAISGSCLSAAFSEPFGPLCESSPKDCSAESA